MSRPGPDTTMFELVETDPEVLRQISHTKRFLERWTADPGFKAMVEEDSYAAVKRYGIDVDPEEIRPLYDRDYAIKQNQELSPDQIPLVVRRYRQFCSEKIAWREFIRETAAPDNASFRTWRERQMARANLQLSTHYNEQIVHTPVTFELSVGCSVGCWFCGVGAKGLAEHFNYTPENRSLWRETLQIVRDVCGEGAKWGFCYWATDPLDNPDYEKFCNDYQEILGLFPQTTTAISMRDVERTRRVLVDSRSKGCRINRFSVMTLKLFNEIHDTFSAEELVFVELVNQNKEADSVKAQAGHFRKNRLKNPKLEAREKSKIREGLIVAGQEGASELADEDLFQPGTTACVSGFLFNMVEKTVKLISPCYANERWPLGYIVFEEGTFSNADELRALLNGMVQRNTSLGVPEDKTLAFMPELEYTELENGFQVASRAELLQFRNSKHSDYLKDIGSALQGGRETAQQIVLRGIYRHGVPEARTMATLNQLLRMGVLNEEPEMAGSSARVEVKDIRSSAGAASLA